MSAPAALRVEITGPTAISLHGDFDLWDVDVLETAVGSLELDPTSELVADATQLGFIGSAGLRALEEVRGRVAQLRIGHASARFRKLLDVTETGSLFALD